MSDQPQRQDEILGPEAGAQVSPPGPAEAWRRRVAIGHPRAFLSGLGIVVYFAVATVWLPSALLRSSLLIWVVAFGIGLWALRRSQDRAWI
jgi:hypothetical protein